MNRLPTQKTIQVPTATYKTADTQNNPFERLLISNRGRNTPPSPLTKHKTIRTIEPDDVDAKPTPLLKNTLDG
jgi:hypothetical protein